MKSGGKAYNSRSLHYLTYRLAGSRARDARRLIMVRGRRLALPAESPQRTADTRGGPQTQVDQVPGGKWAGRVGVLQDFGQSLDREGSHQPVQPGWQAAEGGVEDARDDGDRQEAGVGDRPGRFRAGDNRADGQAERGKA